MTRILLLLCIAACSSLDDVDTGICGNGVLEPGEDCDSSDPRCVQCGIRCELALGDEQCTSFPGAEGFVCGADDFCHAPSGQFHAPTELSTSVESLRASDINSDGYGDLIVQSATAISILFGNADGHPTTSTQVLTPIARGAAYYADLDLDPAKKLDILLPAADGIVAYTSPFDVLSPFPFPSIVSSTSEGKPYYSHALADTVIGFVGHGPGATTGSPVGYFVRDVGPMATNTFIAMGPLCGATDQTFDPHDVDVFHVRADYVLFATTFRDGVNQKLCVLAIENTNGQYTVTELPVTLGVGRSPASKPVFAPIGGGPCPSIVIRERLGVQPPGNVVAFAGAGTLSCSYAVANMRTLASSGAAPVGVAPLVPPDPVTGATVALALSNGVFAVPPTGPLVRQLYVADRVLHAIVFADIDGDDDVDIIANSADAGELVEDIDVLTRVDQGFLRIRLDTAGPVDFLTIGDYDGNGISDVAYVQTRVIGGTARYELAISYATGDQLLPGVGAGTYGRIISLLEGAAPDSSDPFSIVSDLIVLFENDGQSAITILHGSPQRTMLGYFDPDGGPSPTVFRGIVAGHFNDAPGTTGLDMIAIDDGEGTSSPRVWRSNGPTGGEVEQLAPHTVALLADCNDGPSTSLCVDGARYVAWPMADGRDRVIAFGADASGDVRVITFDPHTDAAVLPSAAWPAIPELPARARIREVDVVTLGDSRMLVLSVIAQLQVKLLLCAVGADGIATACHDLAARISDAAHTCTHAAAARVRPVRRFMQDPPTVDDLLVICQQVGSDATTVFRVAVESDAPVSAVEVARVPRARELRIGDIDGNGLADLLMVDREGAVPTVRIARQCSSREVPACGS